MKQDDRMEYPNLSIIIVCRNAERTIANVLKTIANQNYPKNKIEIIIIDGESTDSTLDIVQKARYKIKIYRSKYPFDPESGRGEGLQYAKNEIVGYIDADNYLPHADWLHKIVMPFQNHSNIVGSYAMRFSYRREDQLINRYFALIGSGDPVGLYLGKADKMSYLRDDWNLSGKIVRIYKDYILVQFDKKSFPTLGSNAFFARREFLIKGHSDPEHYFHIDVPYDLLDFGLNNYAIVKDTIGHDPSTGIFSYIRKRINYMLLHYDKRAKDRRYKVFDLERKSDIWNLVKFIIYSTTLIQPLTISIRGYLKVPDIAWFIHPIFCQLITYAYGYAFIMKMIKNQFNIKTS